MSQVESVRVTSVSESEQTEDTQPTSLYSGHNTIPASYSLGLDF
jgi:hypothetical protein